MDKARWEVISPLLDQLLDTEPGQRSTRLEQIRRDDAQLAGELEALLARQTAVGREEFLEGTAVPIDSTLRGQIVGAYTLERPLGQGGMGSVWLAHRSDGRFEGQVAVKFLNLALIARGGADRFRREGSVLAKLTHPNIARLIDAGVAVGGQPYLVLEYIDGEPIDRWCDARALDVAARIRLFLDVLAAVAHAHSNLVLHRDLKPSNILVTGDGHVKLLDFGIAKLLAAEQQTTPATELTEIAGRAFTPDFAAPEQVQGEDATTATDVYALGVLMYLLLSGEHPTTRPQAPTVERLRCVVETEPARVSDAAARASSDVALARGHAAHQLPHALRGDLDNIVAKALRKAPAQRYGTVTAFADDLRRHLVDEPVSARPDSAGYRLGKFVRRHRGGVAAAAVVVVAVIAGSAGTVWQAREAGKQRDIALKQLGRAVATNEFMGFLLSAAAPAGKAFAVSDLHLLEHGERLADKQFADNDPLRVEMLVGIGEHYMAAERWDKVVPVLERAAAIASRGTDPAIQARALCPLAMMKMANGERTAAEATMRLAVSKLPDEPQHALLRSQCLLHASTFGVSTGEAEPMIRNATAAIELLDQVSMPTTLKDIEAQAMLAYGYYLARQNRRADEVYARLLVSLERMGRERTSTAADVLNNWGLVHYQGEIIKAEPLYRHAIELRRSIDPAAINPTLTFNYAGALFELARYEEAKRFFDETIRTANACQEHRIKLDAMMQLTALYIETGDVAGAAAQLETVKPFLDTPPFDARRQALLAYYKGRVALAQNNPQLAHTEFVDSVARLDRQRGGKIALNVMALIGVARAEQVLDHRAEAAAAAQRALALAESFVEPGAPSYLVGLSRFAEGEIQRANGETDAARASFNAALIHLRQGLGENHPAVERARMSLEPMRTGPS